MPSSATYTLTTPGASAPSGGVSGAGIAPSSGPDFLGFGLLAPFTRTAADFANAGGIEHLQSMVGQVLGTMAGSDYTEGELPWRSDFGSLLHLLRHRNNDPVTAELARVYIGEALARWIPQIRLIDVRTEKRKGPEGEENVLEVRIKYRIVGIQQAGNEVLGQPISQSVYLPA